MAAVQDQNALELAETLSQAEIPVKLRCAVCNKVAVNAFKLPCCDQSICANCQSTLPDTCPVCTHAPLDGSTCNPNKSLRLTIKAFLKSEERKRSKSKISVSTKDTASIGTTSVPPTPADDIKVEIQPELAKEQSVLPSVEQSEEPSAVDSANAQLDIKADTNTTDSKQEDVVEVIEPSSTIVQEEDSGITEENHQSVPNPVSWQNQGFGPMMNPMMHMGMMNNGFGGFPATMMMGMPNMFGGFGSMGMMDMNGMNGANYGGVWSGSNDMMDQNYVNNFTQQGYPQTGMFQNHMHQNQNFHKRSNNGSNFPRGRGRGRGGFRGRGGYEQGYENHGNHQNWGSQDFTGQNPSLLNDSNTQADYMTDNNSMQVQNNEGFESVQDFNVMNDVMQVDNAHVDSNNNNNTGHLHGPGKYDEKDSVHGNIAMPNLPPTGAPTGPKAMREVPTFDRPPPTGPRASMPQSEQNMRKSDVESRNDNKECEHDEKRSRRERSGSQTSRGSRHSHLKRRDRDNAGQDDEVGREKQKVSDKQDDPVPQSAISSRGGRSRLASPDSNDDRYDARDQHRPSKRSRESSRERKRKRHRSTSRTRSDDGGKKHEREDRGHRRSKNHGDGNRSPHHSREARDDDEVAKSRKSERDARDSDRDRRRDREREKNRDRDKLRDRERDQRRDKGRDRHRDRSKSRNRNRSRDREHRRQRSDSRSRSRSRSRSPVLSNRAKTSQTQKTNEDSTQPVDRPNPTTTDKPTDTPLPDKNLTNKRNSRPIDDLSRQIEASRRKHHLNIDRKKDHLTSTVDNTSLISSGAEPSFKTADDEDSGIKIKGSSSSSTFKPNASSSGNSKTQTADPYALEREARQKERLEREVKRRESATGPTNNGSTRKRGRNGDGDDEDDRKNVDGERGFAPPSGPRSGGSKRVRL